MKKFKTSHASFSGIVALFIALWALLFSGDSFSEYLNSSTYKPGNPGAYVYVKPMPPSSVNMNRSATVAIKQDNYVTVAGYQHLRDTFFIPKIAEADASTAAAIAAAADAYAAAAIANARVGEKGDRGDNGTNGRDGTNGRNGTNGTNGLNY